MFQRIVCFIAAATACFLVASCSKNGVSPFANKVISPAQVAAIESNVGAIRGLAFRTSPSVDYMTSADYEASIGSQVDEQISSFEDTGLTSELYQLGLLAPTDSSVKTITKVFEGGFPAAFYTQGTNTLTLITDQQISDTLSTIYVAHELTHALQDQYGYLSIEPFPLYSQSGTDSYLAKTSLVEGDAESVENIYAYTYFFAPYVQSNPLASALGYAESERDQFLNYQLGFDSQPYFSAPGYAPYYLGTYFVTTKVSGANPYNWSSVNAYYTVNTLPASSAEIIRGQRITPTSINLAPVQSLLINNLPGIGFTDDDNMGPVVLMASFDEHSTSNAIDGITSADSAFGWTGDHMTYMHQRGKKSGCLVWALTFSNATWAGQFFNYLCGNFSGRQSAQTQTLFTLSDSLPKDSRGYKRANFAAGGVVSRVATCNGNVWWIDNAGTLTGSIDSLLQIQLAQPGPGVAKTIAAPRLQNSFDNAVKGKVIEAILGRTKARGMVPAAHW